MKEVARKIIRMNITTEIKVLDVLVDAIIEKATMIKAYCQQAKSKTGGVSTSPNSKKKRVLTDQQRAELIAKSRARRGII